MAQFIFTILGIVVIFLTAKYWLKPSKSVDQEKSTKSWKRTGFIVLALIIGCVVFVMMLKS